jgi:hypothetical protein
MWTRSRVSCGTRSEGQGRREHEDQGVVTAAAVFLVDVRPHRRSHAAFGVCLAVSLLAGLLGPAVKPAVSAMADAVFAALALM